MHRPDNSFDVAACVNEGGPASKQDSAKIQVWLNNQVVPVNSLESYAKLCATIGGPLPTCGRVGPGIEMSENNRQQGPGGFGLTRGCAG